MRSRIGNNCTTSFGLQRRWRRNIVLCFSVRAKKRKCLLETEPNRIQHSWLTQLIAASVLLHSTLTLMNQCVYISYGNKIMPFSCLLLVFNVRVYRFKGLWVLSYLRIGVSNILLNANDILFPFQTPRCVATVKQLVFNLWNN